MNRLAFRLATLLIFVLTLAPAASAEQWTAVRYVELHAASAFIDLVGSTRDSVHPGFGGRGSRCWL